MLSVPIEKLLEKSKNNRYLLTAIIAQRASRLMEAGGKKGIGALIEFSNPVSQAIKDLHEGRFKPEI